MALPDDYRTALTDLLTACRQHPELRVTEATLALPEPTGPLPHPDWIPASVQALAATTSRFTLHWQAADPGTNAPALAPVKGAVQLLPLAEVYGSWEGILVFDFLTDPADHWRHSFRLVDIIEGAEEMVGLYHDERRDPQLYLCDFEDEPEPLGVDLPGYLALLPYTLGSIGWQDALRDLSETAPGRPVNLAGLPRLYWFTQQRRRVLPAYDPRPFIDCYHRVRLPG